MAKFQLDLFIGIATKLIYWPFWLLTIQLVDHSICWPFLLTVFQLTCHGKHLTICIRVTRVINFVALIHSFDSWLSRHIWPTLWIHHLAIDLTSRCPQLSLLIKRFRPNFVFSVIPRYPDHTYCNTHELFTWFRPLVLKSERDLLLGTFHLMSDFQVPFNVRYWWSPWLLITMTIRWVPYCQDDTGYCSRTGLILAHSDQAHQ